MALCCCCDGCSWGGGVPPQAPDLEAPNLVGEPPLHEITASLLLFSFSLLIFSEACSEASC